MTGGTAIVRRRDEGEEDEEEIEDEEGTRRGTMGGRRSGGELPRETRLIGSKVFNVMKEEQCLKQLVGYCSNPILFFGAMLQVKSKVGEKWSTIINCIGDSVGSRILLTPGTWHSGHHKGDTFECAILDWPPLHSNVGLRFWHVTF